MLSNNEYWTYFKTVATYIQNELRAAINDAVRKVQRGTVSNAISNAELEAAMGAARTNITNSNEYRFLNAVQEAASLSSNAYGSLCEANSNAGQNVLSIRDRLQAEAVGIQHGILAVDSGTMAILNALQIEFNQAYENNTYAMRTAFTALGNSFANNLNVDNVLYHPIYNLVDTFFTQRYPNDVGNLIESVDQAHIESTIKSVNAAADEVARDLADEHSDSDSDSNDSTPPTPRSPRMRSSS